MQPAANEWHWEEFDAALDRARGFSLQLVLGGIGARPPAWAGGGSSRPYGAGSWRNLDDRAYVRFVSAAARRYAGRVRLWSILNESDLTGYPSARYASLYTRSRNAIRRFAGKRSRVLWGEFSPHSPLSYTGRALARTRVRVVADGFAVHPYTGAHAMQGGLGKLGKLKRSVARMARRKRKRLTTPGGNRLPIYATEYGCSTRHQDERECARQWRNGLRQSSRHGLRQLVAYQLVPTDHPSWDTSLLRWDGSPSMAMSLIAKWTRGR